MKAWPSVNIEINGIVTENTNKHRVGGTSISEPIVLIISVE